MGDLRAGRIADVAQARRGLMVVGVGHVDLRDERPRVADHLRDVVAEIGVRSAIEELDSLRVECPDHVDRRMERLAPVLGMRLDAELNPLLL